MTYDVSPLAMFKLKLISAMHALDYFTWPRVGVNLLGLWPRVDAQFPLLGPKSEPFCVEVSPSTHEKHKMLADHKIFSIMVSEVCKIGIHSLGSVCTCPPKSMVLGMLC